MLRADKSYPNIHCSIFILFSLMIRYDPVTKTWVTEEDIGADTGQTEIEAAHQKKKEAYRPKVCLKPVYRPCVIRCSESTNPNPKPNHCGSRGTPTRMKSIVSRDSLK